MIVVAMLECWIAIATAFKTKLGLAFPAGNMRAAVILQVDFIALRANRNLFIFQRFHDLLVHFRTSFLFVCLVIAARTDGFLAGRAAQLDSILYFVDVWHITIRTFFAIVSEQLLEDQVELFQS